jgi:hypothetical protein
VNDMSKPSAILFLGSGATKASGILTQDGKELPTDGEFFDSCQVKRLVPPNDQPCGYPALRAARRQFEIQNNELCKTWQDLFTAKSFSLSGVFKPELPEDILARLSPSSSYDGQREHYECQKEIFKSSNWPTATKLAELAIWDLRVLVKKVYERNPSLDPQDNANRYQTFWDGVEHYVAAVVNLNYDTTFDESLLGRISCQIIRPHGSLGWSTANFWRLNNGWIHTAPWYSDEDSTPLDQLGYRRTAVPEILSFRQSLIVTPEIFKETVVGNSSMRGLQDPILRYQWQQLRRSASKATHWLFFGLSLASGDDHLIFLLESLARENSPTLHVSCFRHRLHEWWEQCPTRKVARRLSDKPCIHPITSYIDEFTESAPQGCVFRS